MQNHETEQLSTCRPLVFYKGHRPQVLESRAFTPAITTQAPPLSSLSKAWFTKLYSTMQVTFTGNANTSKSKHLCNSSFVNVKAYHPTVCVQQNYSERKLKVLWKKHNFNTQANDKLFSIEKVKKLSTQQKLKSQCSNPQRYKSFPNRTKQCYL